MYTTFESNNQQKSICVNFLIELYQLYFNDYFTISTNYKYREWEKNLLSEIGSIVVFWSTYYDNDTNTYRFLGSEITFTFINCSIVLFSYKELFESSFSSPPQEIFFVSISTIF